MMKNLDEKKFLARLEHIDGHFQVEWVKTDRLEFLNTKLKKVHNFAWGFLSLQSYCVLNILREWFHHKDLNKVKNFAYNYAKLQYIQSLPPYNDLGQSYAYENRAFEGLWFLLSNHKPLITWYSQLDHIFSQTANSPKSEQFFTKQFFVALRGDWDTLQQRCEEVLVNPPKSSQAKKFLIDHAFYLALANGDVALMKASICQLLETKTFSNRKELESGYTQNLISTPATLYTKLAWYHGFEINIDSEYVPNAWLDMTPLTEYKDKFDFMCKIEI